MLLVSLRNFINNDPRATLSCSVSSEGSVMCVCRAKSQIKIARVSFSLRNPFNSTDMRRRTTFYWHIQRLNWWLRKCCASWSLYELIKQTRVIVIISLIWRSFSINYSSVQHQHWMTPTRFSCEIFIRKTKMFLNSEYFSIITCLISGKPWMLFYFYWKKERRRRRNTEDAWNIFKLFLLRDFKVFFGTLSYEIELKYERRLAVCSQLFSPIFIIFRTVFQKPSREK